MKTLKKIALLTMLAALCTTSVFAKGKKDKKVDEKPATTVETTTIDTGDAH